MLNHQRLLEQFFTSFITVLSSFIVAETAMSNPTLIVPSQQYLDTDYILNGGVTSMAFALTTRILDIL